MAYTPFNTGNPIGTWGSVDPRDLVDNAAILDRWVNDQTITQWRDRFGVQRLTWNGMEVAFQQAQDDRQDAFDAEQAEHQADFDTAQAQRESDFNAFLLASGYQFIGDYDDDGPLTITQVNQIFSKDGEFWRAGAALTLPYTTVNDWVVDEPKFVSVGDAALRQELAEDDGADKVGWSRQALSSAVVNVHQALDAQSVSVWEFAGLITDKPTEDPATWDWTPAVQAAVNDCAANGWTLRFTPGTYTLVATYQYTLESVDRIACVNMPSKLDMVFMRGVTFKSRAYTGDREYRAMFLAVNRSDINIHGPALFDGQLAGDASNLANQPKVAIVMHAQVRASIEDCRMMNFGLHGVAIYATSALGSSDVYVRRVISVNGRGSSLIAYSSAVNASHLPNQRIYFEDCQGLDSSAFFGLELRGCNDSGVIRGIYSGNITGGVNFEENSNRVIARDVKITGNPQGLIVSGSQGACNDILIDSCHIYSNTASQLSNYAGNRMRVVKTIIDSGSSTGVNILVPAALPVADGIVLDECQIINNTGVGILMRGTNALLRNCVVTGNGTTDVQVSADGFRVEGGTVTNWAFDSTSRELQGFSTDVDAATSSPSFNVLGRLGVDEDRVRIVGQALSGVEFGTVEVVRQGSGSGRVEVYAYLSNARKLIATFTREGDVELATTTRGLIVRSADGTRYRIYVQNGGAIAVQAA